MNSEPDSAIILYPDPQGIVTITCPKCSLSRRVESKSIKKANEVLSVRCRCGDVFRVRVEFRKFYRKAVKLDGVCRNLRTGRMGQIMISDLSLGGVGFRTRGRNDLRPGDNLEVIFNLDDRKNSKLSLYVEVKQIRDPFVGAEIKQESRGNRDLGFYLMG